ncbi:tetraspanin-8-like [Genypterus blacodes]|uniref:tetraspanin-8-like n=1 Tax=Genypterus blacodes TaxID=154954 RepID=UPI003F764DE0
MYRVDPCLKRLFIIFNIFFAIVGGVIIALALLSQVATSTHGGDGMEGRTTGLIVLYIFGSITMVIAILGAYGAHREKKGALIVFLVCMVIGSLVMLRTGVPAAMIRPHLKDTLEERFRRVLPLDKASEDIQGMAEGLQSLLHCCGLFGSDDWEQNIPESCVCNQEEQEMGMCRSISYQVLMRQQKYIFTQPCFPIIARYALLASDILLGVVFTLAALALLGLALSSMIIHQLRPRAQLPVLLSVPAIFSPAPPKYQELQNTPGY